MTKPSERTWDENGIPTDAVENDETYIRLPDQYGRVYRRRHGFSATYSAGCRCARCYRERYRTHKLAKLRSRPMHDGDVIREHMIWLRDVKGMGLPSQARVSGIHVRSLLRILTGRSDGEAGRIPPPPRVQARTGDAILAITGDEVMQRHSQDYVPADLTRYRLRSLVALGYPVNTLVEMIGRRPLNGGGPLHKVVNGQVERVYLETAVAVAELYDKIGDTPPTPIGDREKAAVTSARRRAEREGWGTPASWDDPGTLGSGVPVVMAAECESDEPDRVVVERLMEGKRPEGFTRAERDEAARILFTRGDLSEKQIMERLKVSGRTFYRATGRETRR